MLACASRTVGKSSAVESGKPLDDFIGAQRLVDPGVEEVGVGRMGYPDARGGQKLRFLLDQTGTID